MDGEIRRAIVVLFEPGDTVELRSFKDRTTASGYFNDLDELARQAAGLDGRDFAVYATLNPAEPALLARAQNKIRTYPKATTTDADILRRRWLPVDFDPVRPSGVSATKMEKQAALRRAREVRDYLEALGWPEPVVGDSGNGAHLLYRVNLPNAQASLELIKGVLDALSFKFSDGRVSVDTTTANAARIWKFYGTTARKGDSTEERPHRRSRLIKVPEAYLRAGARGVIAPPTVGQDALEKVSAMRPTSSRGPRKVRKGDGKSLDVGGWLTQHDVAVKREGAWGQGGHKWVLHECPWNGHADNAAYIVQGSDGWLAAGCHHNKCQGLGWRELREHFQPGAYDAAGGDLGGESEKDEWDPMPSPLPDLPAVAAFDQELLPIPLRAWVSDIAERMQVPSDYVAVGALTVSAALVGRKIGIHPKRYDDWLVVPNLWAGIVGPPSALKSPALAETAKPLDRLVAEAREAHERATEGYEAEAAVVEATKAALKKEIDQAAKAHVKTGDRSRLDELIARRRDTQAPEPPTEKRYRTSDSTTEKLAELLKENPNGILVQRDELTGWLRSLDRQGREVDRAFYLEAWNGAGSFDVDRIGRGTLHVPALCVSIIGGIQPGPLRSYVHEAARGGEGADGLLQRFQLLVWPDPPKGRWRNVDRYPDATAKNRAYAVYAALDGLSPEGARALSEDDGIPALRFSSKAQEIFDAWRDELETELRGDELSAAFGSHLAKYRSLMPSLALVFHLLAVADGTLEAGPVGRDAAMRAAAWCEYLRSHAKRLYACVDSPEIEGARALLDRIRKGDVKDGDTLREIYRNQWSGLSSSEAVKAAAEVLEDHGWLRVDKPETGGRRTTALRLHPNLKGQA